jgi:hypothetical protein
VCAETAWLCATVCCVSSVGLPGSFTLTCNALHIGLTKATVHRSHSTEEAAVFFVLVHVHLEGVSDRVEPNIERDSTPKAKSQIQLFRRGSSPNAYTGGDSREIPYFFSTQNPSKKNRTLHPKLQTQKKTLIEKSGIFREKSGFVVVTWVSQLLTLAQ